MNFYTIDAAVIQWGKDRKIIQNASPEVQALKTMSEVGEMADALIKGDIDNFMLELGDVVVTLVILAEMKGVDLTECFALAYNKIKDRTGTMMPNGVFVKDS